MLPKMSELSCIWVIVDHHHVSSILFHDAKGPVMSADGKETWQSEQGYMSSGVLVIQIVSYLACNAVLNVGNKHTMQLFPFPILVC